MKRFFAGLSAFSLLIVLSNLSAKTLVEHEFSYDPVTEAAPAVAVSSKGNLTLVRRKYGTNFLLSEVNFEVRNKKKKVVAEGPIDELTGQSSFSIPYIKGKSLFIRYVKEDGSNLVFQVFKTSKKGAKAGPSQDLPPNTAIDPTIKSFMLSRVEGTKTTLTRISTKFKEMGSIELEGDVGSAPSGRNGFIAEISQNDPTNFFGPESVEYKVLNGQLEEQGSFGPVTVQGGSAQISRINKSYLIQFAQPGGTNREFHLLNAKLENAETIEGVDGPNSSIDLVSESDYVPLGFPFIDQENEPEIISTPFGPLYIEQSPNATIVYTVVQEGTGTNVRNVRIVLDIF